MAFNKPFLLTKEAIAQIQQVVQSYNNRNYKNLNEPLKRGRWQGRYPGKERRYQGKLDEALAIATTFNDDPSTATFSVWERDENGDMVETAMDLTVTNRCLYLSYTTGTICKVEFIDGEWQIYAADCEAV